MKSKLTKFVAATAALTLAISSLAVPTMAAGASGTVKVGFGVFSPKMTVTIPTTAALTVNPMFTEVESPTSLNNYSVASEAIGIENRTTTLINGEETAVPLKCKVNATIASAGEGVEVAYSKFDENSTSSKKKIGLNITELGLVYSEANDEAGEPIYALNTTGGITTKTTPITKEGSSLTIAVAAPTIIADEDDGTVGTIAAGGGGFGGFAITGQAYTDADWNNDDIALALTYDIKPAVDGFQTNGAVGATLTTATGTAAADAVITFTTAQLNDATIEGVYLHNDAIEDYEFTDIELEPVVEDNVDNTGAVIGKKVTIAKEEYADYAGTTIDAVIVLSDGRTAVVPIPNTAS